MTSTNSRNTADYSWETEKAPRITTARWIAVLALFVLWTLFLLAMAIHRWIVTLQ